jgi:hypothetical protein
MKHPFAIKNDLSAEQIDKVSGAGFYRNYQKVQEVEIKSKMIRPPVGSTMAIGEEGGSAQDTF